MKHVETTKYIKVQNRLWQMISTDGKSNGKRGQQIKIPVAPSHQGGSAPRIFFPAQESIILVRHKHTYIQLHVCGHADGPGQPPVPTVRVFREPAAPRVHWGGPPLVGIQERQISIWTANFWRSAVTYRFSNTAEFIFQINFFFFTKLLCKWLIK